MLANVEDGLSHLIYTQADHHKFLPSSPFCLLPAEEKSQKSESTLMQVKATLPLYLRFLISLFTTGALGIQFYSQITNQHIFLPVCLSVNKYTPIISDTCPCHPTHFSQHSPTCPYLCMLKSMRTNAIQNRAMPAAGEVNPRIEWKVCCGSLQAASSEPLQGTLSAPHHFARNSPSHSPRGPTAGMNLQRF